MGTRRRSALLATGVGAALVLGTGVAIAQSGSDAQDDGTAPETTTATTTTEVLDALAFNLEEERMARDLYGALGEAHDGLAPFERIEVAEQRHYDAVARLITLKEGTLPEDEVPGVYPEAEIQAVYDDWLERGLVSPEAALEVGIELEEADIEHLRSTIEDIDDADLDRVLGHLLNASERHLAAFEAAAAGELPEMPRTQDGRRGGPGSGMQQDDRGQGMRQGPGGQGQGMGQGPGGQGQGKQHRGDCPMTSTDD